MKKTWEKIEKKSRVIVIGLFILMTLLGLLVTPDYGMPWDELLEIRTLGSNVREYVGLFKGEREEPTRSTTGIVFPDYKENVDMDHGQSVYYPLGPALFAKYETGGPRTLMLIWHVYTFLIFMAGVIALYFICKFLAGDWKYGVLGSLFLYLSPRFFAEGHYNSKDVVALALGIICLALGIKMIESKRFVFAVLFALVAAIATNMRMNAVFLFGLLGILYLVHLSVKKQWSKRNFAVGLTAVLSFLGIYYLISPAAWRAPLQFIGYVFARSTNFEDWGGIVFFQGTIHRPVPWYYIPVMIAVTTPILILLLVIAGHATSILQLIRDIRKREFSKTTPYYILCVFYIMAFLLFTMIKLPILYNSWRHLFFLYGPMLILAVGAVQAIVDRLKGKLKAVAIGVVGVQLLACLLIIIISHPFQYVYLNALAGPEAGENYEYDYWNVSQVKLLMKLIDKENSDEPLKIYAIDWYTADGLEKAIRVLPESYKKRITLYNAPSEGSSNTVDFMMVNNSVRQIAELEREYGVNWIYYGREYADPIDQPIAASITAFGSEYMMVYDMREGTAAS
ncbi:MAG: hypothetical protein PHP22_07245 [Oscillospiraceae bacterium]|nr:hypothetical protein [Oscillospiraceae bacterium]